MQLADRAQQLADRVWQGLGTTQDTNRNRRGNSHFTGRLRGQPQRGVVEREQKEEKKRNLEEYLG